MDNHKNEDESFQFDLSSQINDMLDEEKKEKDVQPKNIIEDVKEEGHIHKKIDKSTKNGDINILDLSAEDTVRIDIGNPYFKAKQNSDHTDAMDESNKEEVKDKGKEEKSTVSDAMAVTSEPEDGTLKGGYEDDTPTVPEDSVQIEDFISDLSEDLGKQIQETIIPEADAEEAALLLKKKKKKRIIIATSILVPLLLIVCVGLFLWKTEMGNRIVVNTAGDYIYGNLNVDESSRTASEESDGSDSEATAVVEETQEQTVYNILLLGLEEINGAQNTDVMIIATLNTEENTLKLTSLMRDIYVDIEGHTSQKLNAAYSLGGIDLLYDTIENNFGVQLDGYLAVNFDSFEDVVDLLGGVEVTLSQKEATYLNTTNYISNPSYRNVYAGTQTLNGNQAVGYCRIRKVSTETESDDFGRTSRQRTVLQAMYTKLKQKNLIELTVLMNTILNTIEVQTDLTNDEFNLFLNEAVKLKMDTLETNRIPLDGTYELGRRQIGSYNLSVIIIQDWLETRKELKEIIYGTSDSEDTESDETETESEEDESTEETANSDTGSTVSE